MSVQRNLRLAYAERDYLSDDNEEQEVETPRDAESEPKHDEEDSEFTTPEPVASTLEEAIRLAPPGQLRSILNFLCEKNDFAKGFTSACLIYQPNNDSGRKRKVFAQCKTCGVEYDVVASAGENCIADCRYHPGKTFPTPLWPCSSPNSKVSYRVQGRKSSASILLTW